MKWQVTFSRDALKQLKKLDKHTASLILGWIRKNLEGCENPRLHGKALTANRTGQWRYRVGDYRIIAELQDKQIVILILNVGHRRDIYNT
ncbi:MAG: type II toxin-antitoxin system RelE/ParE family toxin [Clostridia bacterium]|nr:type II toxin-antitoxin system RelE/ParE family toxin [Clostridia bacterium]